MFFKVWLLAYFSYVFGSRSTGLWTKPLLFWLRKISFLSRSDVTNTSSISQKMRRQKIFLAISYMST